MFPTSKRSRMTTRLTREPPLYMKPITYVTQIWVSILAFRIRVKKKKITGSLIRTLDMGVCDSYFDFEGSLQLARSLYSLNNHQGFYELVKILLLSSGNRYMR